MNDLERQVMDMLLRGDHPILTVLRAQLAVASVSSREFTGVGFFTKFAVPPTIPRLAVGRLAPLGDVNADVPGMQHGAGFVLFFKDGALDCLEGFSYGAEPFSREATGVRLHYLKPRRPGSPELIKTVERDIGHALGEFA